MKQVLTALCVLFFLVSCASVPSEGVVPTMMAPTQAASPTVTSTALPTPTSAPSAIPTTAPSAARLATLAPVAPIAPIATLAPAVVQPTQAPTVIQPTQAPTAVQPTQAPAVVQPTQVPAAGGCPNGCVAASPTCQIKGNISSAGEKIYHVPGGASYNATMIDPNAGERWFCTGAEAVANGWRAAAR